jgi:hypothetical protein
MLNPTMVLEPEKRYCGAVEGFDNGKYWGWAIDIQRPNPPKLDVYIDDIKISSITPRIKRYDLLANYGRIAAGFDFYLDPHKILGLSFFHGHALSIRFPDGSDLHRLEGVPAEISASRAPINDIREALGQGLRFSTKHGSMIRPFSSDTALSLNRIARFVRFMQHAENKLGLKVCVAYGTLLGAVRDKNVIPHDDDFDTFAIVEANSLAELSMKRLGEPLYQNPASASGLVYQFEGEFFDIFVAWLRPDGFLCSYHLDMKCTASEIFDFVNLELGGHLVPGPANARSILANTYGEGWSVPDPEFQWTPPESSIVIADIWLERLQLALGNLGADPYLDPTRPGPRVKWHLEDTNRVNV